MAFDISTLPSYGIYYTVGTVNSVSTTITIKEQKLDGTFQAPARQVDNTPANDVFLEDLPIVVDADNPLKKEGMYLTGGVDNGDGSATYTITRRGIRNVAVANPPVAGDDLSRNYSDHSTSSFCIIDFTWVFRYQNAQFETAIANETYKSVGVEVISVEDDTSTGNGKAYITIPEIYNNYNLTRVFASTLSPTSKGVTGVTTIQIRNQTDSVDMLSTKLTIDAGEVNSSTAATPAVIDTTKDDVVTNDLLAIDIDTVCTTPTKGLSVILEFTKQ